MVQQHVFGRDLEDWTFVRVVSSLGEPSDDAEHRACGVRYDSLA